jgi:hypothetical protein
MVEKITQINFIPKAGYQKKIMQYFPSIKHNPNHKTPSTS